MITARAYVKSHIKARGINRVADALARWAPPEVKIVDHIEDANLVVRHVVGFENFSDTDIVTTCAQDRRAGRQYAIVQYCHKSARDVNWQAVWGEAAVVWSYLPIDQFMPHGARYHRTPLGLDDAFIVERQSRKRDIDVITTGYVDGEGAEAISAVAYAAEKLGLRVVHIGPYPARMRTPFPAGFNWVQDISDETLAQLYWRARYVSGLRYVEGFELPAIEGRACGAWPIMFNREDATTWHRGNACYVEETPNTDALIDQLEWVLSTWMPEIEAHDREATRALFHWPTIIGSFWQQALIGMYEKKEEETV